MSAPSDAVESGTPAREQLIDEAELARRRQNTAVLAVGALAAAGMGVALLSMLMNNQRGMTVVRM
ncbi:hypothetical protein ACN2WE_30675 [Streptomyces sp. cg28]|uniref:hypothetical protein n=1 Tax=Streptomyces sp. cg28 TaxID=3403457 RepID=UPI003B2151B2